MSISTTAKPEDKKEKIKKLREYHQLTLDGIGASEASFIPKMAYRPTGKTDLHIGFFESEINKGEDVFVEFTSKELEPEDPERNLYRWRFNPHYAEEYELLKTADGKSQRYMVPVSELIAIPKADKNFTIADPDQDQPINQMTMRDLAAILLKKPVSHKEWLNKIIKEA